MIDVECNGASLNMEVNRAMKKQNNLNAMLIDWLVLGIFFAHKSLSLLERVSD